MIEEGLKTMTENLSGTTSNQENRTTLASPR